jgi:D-glycero-D-manno-heptose 1,7-bisphosphate phosphatase
MNEKTIFLDKDGTLIENVPNNIDLSKVRLLDGVREGLKALHEAGFQLIIVTNQPGVALGHFSENDLMEMGSQLTTLFRQAGVPLAGFYYCPHHPDGNTGPFRQSCFCRKPLPGLLLNAAREHGIDLESSWMVGDMLDDVEAGRRAGCRTALVDNGNETEWRFSALRRPHVSGPDFLSVVKKILAVPTGSHYLVAREVRKAREAHFH